ncbi:4-hydroxy-tetrahydrodipicolinate synthase [Arthrobacter globiformis]|uniref:4-hydroxy-tetrahydrodipicolinate synthase n=1 Tax=Arthrobacter globiformis TaxID=1665 RepID=UPI00397B845C
MREILAATGSTDLLRRPFGSLLTAMVTPFTAAGEVDLDAAAALAAGLVDGGSDGLVVCGTAGEASTLEDQEKEDLIRVVKETVGNQASIVAGTGTNCTARSISMARRAARAGADGQLVVTPYYSKPTQAGVAEHFTRIAEETDLPVMLYDIPGRAGIAISTVTMKRLAENARIVALKDAKADFSATTVVLAETDLAVYAGDDALALPWLAAGASGLVSVSAHAAPGAFRQLVDAVHCGNLALARRLHFELAPLVRAVMDHIPAATAAKHILHRQQRLAGSFVRSPLTEPTGSEARNLAAEVAGTAWALN